LAPPSGPSPARAKLNATDKRANRALKWLAFAGGATVFLAMFFIGYQVILGATLAIDKFGIGFVGHTGQWNPGLNEFGAWPLIYGTLVTSVFSLVLATILGVSIGLFLSLMAPRLVSTIVGPLVEMLAAIPSVVLGLIGIQVISPFVANDLEEPLHSALGFIPVFGTPQGIGNSLFTASLVLTIMVLPIIAALTRDLFLTVPQELRDGAEALGATRWEMIRGVVLPTTRNGVIAACVLGFGRAIGEAIAVSQVVGNQYQSPINWFKGGDTLASRVALQFEGAVSALHTSVLFYLALILFVFGLIVNLLARQISRGAIR
jgi:phosphate transport system permease protein